MKGARYMLNIDRVWSRVSRQPPFMGRRLDEFGLQVVVLRIASLVSTASSDDQQVNFPNGAIILGITAAASVAGQAGTQAIRNGLDLFSVNMSFQQNRTIVGQNKAIASSIFGTGQFDVFPAKEIVVPTQGQLIYGFTGLTSSTIEITVSHHCLVPIAVG